MHKIIVDTRWQGHSGIARFSREVISRLRDWEPLQTRCRRMAPWEPLCLSRDCRRMSGGVYFSPSFTTPLWLNVPLVFTIHDLIHRRQSPEHALAKRIYYDVFVRRAARRAFRVLTVSEFSRQGILEWSGLPPERVTVVGGGVSKDFTADGPSHEAPWPYLLYVGNFKPHKNLPRVLEAFGRARIPREFRLMMTSRATDEMDRLVSSLGLTGRVVFGAAAKGDCGPDDPELAGLYRGARALLMASLCEGFGLPAVEAMACGTPVVAANTDSLPEVVGDAAVLVDPRDVDSIAAGIEAATQDDAAQKCIQRGLLQAEKFRWDRTAGLVQQVLDEAVQSEERREKSEERNGQYEDRDTTA